MELTRSPGRDNPLPTPGHSQAGRSTTGDHPRGTVIRACVAGPWLESGVHIKAVADTAPPFVHRGSPVTCAGTPATTRHARRSTPWRAASVYEHWRTATNVIRLGYPLGYGGLGMQSRRLRIPLKPPLTCCFRCRAD